MTYHINVIDHEGSPHKIEATVGFSIMEIIRDAGLDICLLYTSDAADD